MLKRIFFLFILFLSTYSSALMAQCPVNIGFEMGDFTNWTKVTGTLNADGTYNFNGQSADQDVFSIITRASQKVDPFAQFSLSSPNGSANVAMLGSSSTGQAKNYYNKAQKITYTFTVPANNNEFSLIYYYAIVLESPADDKSHTDLTKPKFTAAVFDVTDNKYTDCANFNFVSISNLPGFTKAPVQKNNDVYYKGWSPVTIDLRGYAGKTLRLEFTTNNCAPGGHFGYAYIDVNQNCTSPVSGNVICNYATSVTLKAPSGFESYKWYNGRDFSTIISTDANLTISPVPALYTQYSVAITPYSGLGCPDTVTTTIQPPENLTLVIKDTLSICSGQTADITKPSIIAGSDPTYTYNYTYDIAGTNFIADPVHINTAGTYYIQAITPYGCTYAKPITVTYLLTPTLVINPPPEVCAPATVDITAEAITHGSTYTGPLTYFRDTIQITNAQAKVIAKSGTYYIKAINLNRCYDIQPVTVLIDDLPVLTTHTIEGCNTADMTVPAATAGSTGSFTLTYFYDAAATQQLSTQQAQTVTTSGRYYIKATTPAGCTVIDSIHVYVYPYPQFTPVNPPAVVFPATVDVTHSFIRQTGTVYYFYLDSLATKLIPDPTKILTQGTYYIKAVNGNSCALIQPVVVTILPPATVDYTVNTFTPNGDGTNDYFRIVTPESFKTSHFRIYGSWGGLLFDAADSNRGWDGTVNGKLMPVGTYYWILDGYDTYAKKIVKKSGSITLVR